MHCFRADAEEASSEQQCHQLLFIDALQAQLDLSKISDIL